MSFSDYSTSPASNTTIGGVSVAEGCAAGNVNNALRQIAADGKELSDTVAGINTSALMPKAGGAFTAQITRSGSGGYLYNANATQSGGKVSILVSGSARPASPSEGDMVFYY
jgi:hypothetical protein